MDILDEMEQEHIPINSKIDKSIGFPRLIEDSDED